MTSSLSAAIADLERELGSLPAEDLPAAAGELSRLHGLALARIVAENSAPREPAGDHLLTVKEAAGVLGAKEDWIYRNAEKLPFTVRLSEGQVRFSANGVQKWIRLRAGGISS